MKALGGGRRRPARKKPARRGGGGGMPKMTKGTVDKVECPFCKGPLDFRDMMPDAAGGNIDGLPAGHGGVLDQGDVIECEHCGNKSDVAAIKQITVIYLRPPERG